MSIDKIITKAAIAGTVKDSVTGLPLAGVSVKIAGSNIISETRDDGFYFFVNLPPGAYSITVSSPKTGSRYGSVTVSGVNVSIDSKGVPCFDERANIVLTPTCIQGVISSAANGDAVAGAKIATVGGDAYTVSASNGTYTLTGLYEGTPNIQISAAGFKTVVKKATLHAGVITIENINLEP